MHLGGSAGEAPFVGDGQEDFERTQVHRRRQLITCRYCSVIIITLTSSSPAATTTSHGHTSTRDRLRYDPARRRTGTGLLARRAVQARDAAGARRARRG